MKIEDQVCTTSQGFTLRTLGVIQKSLFYHHPAFDRPVFGETVVTETGKQYKKVQVCNDKKGATSAFTVAELGVMLPPGYDTMLTTDEGWRCYDHDGNDIYESEGYINEASCRAEAIIYLISTKVISPAEVNQRLKK